MPIKPKKKYPEVKTTELKRVFSDPKSYKKVRKIHFFFSGKEFNLDDILSLGKYIYEVRFDDYSNIPNININIKIDGFTIAFFYSCAEQTTDTNPKFIEETFDKILSKFNNSKMNTNARKLFFDELNRFINLVQSRNNDLMTNIIVPQQKIIEKMNSVTEI